MDVDGNDIFCWSPEDAVTGIMQHRRSGAHREPTDTLYIDFTRTPSQWGRAPADHWTRSAWDSALQAVGEHYNITGTLQIYLPATYSTPLQELLYSITHLDTSHCPAGFKIHQGTISLSELQQWYQESGVTSRRVVELRHTTLQLPTDEQARKLLLLQGVGEVIQNGVKHHIAAEGLTDGRLWSMYRLSDGALLVQPDITFM